MQPSTMRPASSLPLIGLLILLTLGNLPVASSKEENATTQAPVMKPSAKNASADNTTDHKGPKETGADNTTDHKGPKETDDDPAALLDVVLILGGSGNLTHFNFRMLKKVVERFANAIGIDPNGNHVGVELVDCPRIEAIHLTGDITILRYKLMGLQHPQELCLTAHAFERVPVMFRSHGRMNATHVVVVISDGASVNSTTVVAAADELKKDGVVIYTVAVGPKADKEELKEISSSASTIEADNFRDVRNRVVRALAMNIEDTASDFNKRRSRRAG